MASNPEFKVTLKKESAERNFHTKEAERKSHQHTWLYKNVNMKETDNRNTRNGKYILF